MTYTDYSNEDEQTIKYIDYDISNFTFSYNFTKDTCHKVATGICILDEWKNRLSKIRYKLKDRHKYPHCVSLYFCLVNKIPLSNPPWISKCKCGHYVCTDGQHRTCIAQKMNLLIDVAFFKDIEERCLDCH